MKDRLPKAHLRRVILLAIFDDLVVVILLALASVILSALAYRAAPWVIATAVALSGGAIYMRMRRVFDQETARYRRSVARERLTALFLEGQKLGGGMSGQVQATDANIVSDWISRVEWVVRQHLDESYIGRLRELPNKAGWSQIRDWTGELNRIVQELK